MILAKEGGAKALAERIVNPITSGNWYRPKAMQGRSVHRMACHAELGETRSLFEVPLSTYKAVLSSNCASIQEACLWRKRGHDNEVDVALCASKHSIASLVG